MKKLLNIIFTIDESYIQHFTVALVSVCENNVDLPLNVFIIHDLKDTNVLKEIILFFENKYPIAFNLLSLESSLFDNYKLTDHVSKATYFRLMLSDIMPLEIDQAIFLDSDIIVTASLNELAGLDLRNDYIMAVNEQDIDSVDRLNNLGIPAREYFNAGVLIINLKLWRQNNVSTELVATAKEYMDKLLWWDQDVLNIYFYDKWKELPSKFNKKNIINKLKELPVIIHFAGASKPWHYLNNHPYKKLYWKYLKKTPFKDYRYKDFSLKNLIKRVVYFNRTL
ncbi:glycosyltransferase family 8 protein [Mucilaginibacter lappiensis]|uniref:Lipopolysaccharide biosynthesis glycosyltransferase n=1 Tax=Mucilaginibacter lappiensis TaxID=354630 RepID=A0A841J8G2_9SPHI|nr:glycosyltransferase family 8 protein [Mucilaginibacter lappiensis]MBB6127040.1 lipopolysaccharide biosynthesis glycosyltransferase [Mucilaginibacter lappiensis]